MNRFIKKSAKNIGRVKSQILSGDGFTLVELSTIVMIIGILLLIAAPSFISISSGSKIKACESNLRVFDGGIQQYVLDFGISPGSFGEVVPIYVKKIPPEPTGGTYAFIAATSSSLAHVECSRGHSY